MQDPERLPGHLTIKLLQSVSSFSLTHSYLDRRPLLLGRFLHWVPLHDLPLCLRHHAVKHGHQILLVALLAVLEIVLLEVAQPINSI